MHEFLRRGGWVFLAVLFIVTALGVGVYAFVANTGSSSNSNYITCSQKKIGEQKPGKNGKYEGAKLVDYTPVKHIDYVYCQDSKIGSGPTATATSTITVNYTGALAKDGTIFQSSLDNKGQPLTQALNQLIPGWQGSIPGMKVGGTRRLFIPAQYGYGSQALPGIPANSDLVFDVTLLAVK